MTEVLLPAWISQRCDWYWQRHNAGTSTGTIVGTTGAPIPVLRVVLLLGWQGHQYCFSYWCSHGYIRDTRSHTGAHGHGRSTSPGPHTPVTVTWAPVCLLVLVQLQVQQEYKYL